MINYQYWPYNHDRQLNPYILRYSMKTDEPGFSGIHLHQPPDSLDYYLPMNYMYNNIHPRFKVRATVKFKIFNLGGSQ